MTTKLGTLTLDLVARIGSFTQGMRQASTTAEREMGRVQNSVVTVDGLIKKLAVTAGAVFSVGQIINAADEYTQMAAQISNATSSQLEYDKVQKHLLETANTTYRSLKEAQQVYLDIGGALKAYGVNTDKALRITDSLSFSFTHNATATDKAKSATDAYMKSVYEGSVSGDSWRAMLSAIPSIVDDMSASLGKSKDEILTLGNAGKFTSTQLNDSFDKSREKSEELANAMSNSLKDGAQVLINAFSVLAGEANMTYGVTNKMAEGLGILAENLDGIVKVAGLMAAVYAGKVVSSYTASIVASVQQRAALTAEQDASVQLLAVQVQKARHNVALALTEVNLARAAYNNATTSVERAAATQRLTSANIALAISEKQATIATTTYTTASTAAAGATTRLAATKAMLARVGTGLLGALGGPVGLAVMLSTVAAGYLLTRDSTDESTKSLRENNETVEDAIKKYNELDEVKRRAQLVSEKDRLQDLGKEYDDITAKLITATYSFSRHNDMTSEQSQQVNALIAEYKKSGDIDEFSAKINSLSFINQTSKDRFNTLGGAVKSAGDEFKNQKSTVEQMAPALKGTADQAKQSAVEVSGLSEELKKLFDQANQNLKNSQVTIALADRGYNDEMISLAQKYLAIEGAIVKNEQGKKVLRDDLKKLLKAEYDAIMGAKNAVDGRNKSEEKTKKLIEAQGAAMKVNALVAANAAKYNFAAIESKNKLPAGLLSAIHMQESKGDPNAYNKSSGATGGFQFLEGTADQYGVKNRNDLAQSAEGAGKYMAYLLKLFKGDLDKAVSAYHAGEGNVQRGTNIGPVNREYVKNIKGYIGGASGVSFTEDYSFDEWMKEQEKIAVERANQAQKQKEIQLSVATEIVRIQEGLKDKIKEINESGFDAVETARLKAEYTTRAENEIKIAESAHADKLAEYSAYVKTEEQLINESYDRRQRDLKLDLSLTADEYKKLSLLLEGERDKELQKAAWRALEVRQAMSDQIKNLSSGAEDINARASMSPQAYAEWSLSNNRSNAQLDLKNQRVGVEQDIMTSDLYSNDDDRYGALVEAHQAYRDGLAAIDVDYYQKRDDLQNQTQAASLAGYGAMFGIMGSMLDAYGDKESTSYKVAFAMQKGFVLASAIMNAKGAIMSAWNDPANVTIWQKMAGAAAVTVQTNDLMSAIQGTALAGMAHDGIDNIPKEGTWLLDKGERVVDSRTNADLKNMIANQKNGGGDVNIHNTITIASDGSATSESDSKQLGALINNAVLAVIRREQRQGGLLSK